MANVAGPTIAAQVPLTQPELDVLAHVLGHMRPNTIGWMYIDLPEPLTRAERDAFMAAVQKFSHLGKQRLEP